MANYDGRQSAHSPAHLAKSVKESICETEKIRKIRLKLIILVHTLSQQLIALL